jgi:hypothetical protein
MNLKRNCIALFAALSLFVSTSLTSAQLVSILLTDTLADNIEYSVEQDLLHMYLQSHKIAEITGLKLKTIILSSTKLHLDNIYDTVNDLELFPNDIVIIYFSGHGYRMEDTVSQWPNVFISLSNAGLVFDEFVKSIQNKNPRFILAIVDCCNNIVDFDIDTYSFSTKGFINVDKNTIEGYKKLFLMQKGVVLISSSSIGEYSNGTYTGGALTNAFLDNLEFEAKQKGLQASWQKVLQKTVDFVSEHSHEHSPQNPQFIITSHL